jgi:hypothetical protein
MDKVKKPSDSEFIDTPSSEPFRFYLQETGSKCIVQ